MEMKSLKHEEQLDLNGGLILNPWLLLINYLSSDDSEPDECNAYCDGCGEVAGSGGVSGW